MARGKLRILYLMEILLERTDEENKLNAEELSALLAQATGEKTDRKTIYRDVESLREYGLDIRQVKGSSPGYFVGRRDFDLAELKLLVDAVQASKFIPSARSRQLIGKLEKQTSRQKAALLQRQVYIAHRAKTENDRVLANVDVIHTAIYLGQKLSFQYGEWTVEGKMRLRREGRRYVVSPWALVWDNENYYLVAYSDEAGAIRHYRVDKLKGAAVEGERRQGESQFQDFDLPAFSKKTFGMFGGPDVTVRLECANELAGVIIDRFGREVMMIPCGPDRFRVRVRIALSRQFFGWAAGIGPKMKILGPDQVVRQYTDYLRALLAPYTEEET